MRPRIDNSMPAATATVEVRSDRVVITGGAGRYLECLQAGLRGFQGFDGQAFSLREALQTAERQDAPMIRRGDDCDILLVDGCEHVGSFAFNLPAVHR